MKTSIFLLFTIVFSFFTLCQELKTYSGKMQDAILDHGNANYSYYEKDGQIIRHGKFSYTWSDKKNESLRGKSYSYSLIKTINGEFKDGLKHGKWSYNINFVDYPLGHSMVGVNGDIFSTGSIIMTANYEQGEAYGNWTYVENYKDRYMAPSYNTWNWSAYGAPESHSISVNFKKGDVVGKMTRKDSFTKINIDLNFDEKGYIDGIGTIDEKGNKMTYTTKNGMLIKEVNTNMSSGSSKVVVDNSKLITEENSEISKTEFSMLENRYGQISQTLSYFRQNKYFNYKMPFGNDPLIGGDKIMTEGFGGALMIKIEPCKQFLNSYCGGYNSPYEKAKNSLYYGSVNQAISEYRKCIECLNSATSGVCSDEKAKYLVDVENEIKKIEQDEIERKAKKELKTLTYQLNLLNVTSQEFQLLIKDLEKKEIDYKKLFETFLAVKGNLSAYGYENGGFSYIFGLKEGAQLSYKTTSGSVITRKETLFETQYRSCMYLISNLSNYPFAIDETKKYYQNLFSKYTLADFRFLFVYSNTFKKIEKMLSDESGINEKKLETIMSEIETFKQGWVSELKTLNSSYINSKYSDLLQLFQIKLNMNVAGSSNVDFNYSLEKYPLFYETLNARLEKIYSMENSEKIGQLSQWEKLLHDLLLLKIKDIEKGLSKIKSNSNEEKFEYLKASIITNSK